MPHESPKTIICAAAREIIEKAGFLATATWGDGVIPQVVISGSGLSALIGPGGERLSALEHLVRLIALRRVASDERLPDFILDIDNYRRAQIDRVAGLADEMARRVQLTGRAEALPSMTAQERKIIHVTLASYPELTTESIGAEPNRRVVIKKALAL